jgi:hypothetical protein
MKCPKCNINMVAGRRRDKGDSVAVFQETWTEGKPKSGGIGGFFSGSGKGHNVITYACAQCGKLESYLAEKVEKE